MSWSIQAGDDKNPMYLIAVDDAEARFSSTPRLFRSRSFAERLLKKAKAIVRHDMILIQE